MQTVIQVVCTKGESVREKITNDPRLSDHLLSVKRVLQPNRFPGWLKLGSTEPGRLGVINVEWDGSTNILTCRVINRGEGKPSMIVGDFLEYLLARHRKRIQSVLLVPGR